MSDTNKNCDSCRSCYSCDSCAYCRSCDSCYSCAYCDSCSYCDCCYSCSSCDSCYSCSYCDYCSSCSSCSSCYSCDSCDSCAYCSYCHYSTGLRKSERMLFCLGAGRGKSSEDGYQKNNCVFNVQVTPEEWDKAKASLPIVKIELTTWVNEDDMTDKEKEENSGWEKRGGYLKTLGYKEAWAKWWEENPDERQKFLDLPHFDADIFKEITGIDVEKKCHPDTITVDGVTYRKAAGERHDDGGDLRRSIDINKERFELRTAAREYSSQHCRMVREGARGMKKIVEGEVVE